MRHNQNRNKHKRLGNGYSVFQNEIYYKKSLPGISSYSGGPYKTEVEYKTFYNLGYRYAKDRNYIFYQGEVISNSDYNSFSIIPIENAFPKIADEFITPSFKMKDRPTPKISSSMFKHQIIFTLEFYAKDKNNVYYGINIIPDADPETFQLLSILFSKDKNNAYFCNNPILDSNPDSFKLIYGRLAKDNEHVYYNDKIISNNPSSFTFLSKNYAKDDQSVWYYYDPLMPISKLDTLNVNSADEFKLIADRYAEDSKNVYVNGKKIEKANVKHFQLLGGFWSKDDQYIFLFDKVCTEADYKTFEVTNENAKDKNRIFDKNYRIRD